MISTTGALTTSTWSLAVRPSTTPVRRPSRTRWRRRPTTWGRRSRISSLTTPAAGISSSSGTWWRNLIHPSPQRYQDHRHFVSKYLAFNVTTITTSKRREVNGGDSRSRGREFESWSRILDEIFIFLLLAWCQLLKGKKASFGRIVLLAVNYNEVITLLIQTDTP